MLWAPILKELESKTGHRMDISNCRAPPNFTEKLTPHSMPKGSTWFNTSEIDGKSEYCPGCISRRKSRYGKTALTPAFGVAINSRSPANSRSQIQHCIMIWLSATENVTLANRRFRSAAWSHSRRLSRKWLRSTLA